MAYSNKKKRYNRQTIPVADIVGGVLDTRRLKMRLLHEDIFRQWQKVVGKGLVDKCQPRRIKGHTLHLDVVSSSWAHQLIYMQEEIISRVNRLAGTLLVASIHCRAVKKSVLKSIDSVDKPINRALDAGLVSVDESRKWQSEIAAIVKNQDLCTLLSRMRCHCEIKKRARQAAK